MKCRGYTRDTSLEDEICSWFPEIELTIARPDYLKLSSKYGGNKNLTRTKTGLVDTGSPLSFIPENLANELNLRLIGEPIYFSGIGNYNEPYQAFKRDILVVVDKSSIRAAFVGWGETFIIGRDLLNQLDVSLQGHNKRICYELRVTDES